jgi:hypothetical protein
MFVPQVVAAITVPGRASWPSASPGWAARRCSPLTISFGQERLTAISASVAGGVIARSQFGYGLALSG